MNDYEYIIEDLTSLYFEKEKWLEQADNQYVKRKISQEKQIIENAIKVIKVLSEPPQKDIKAIKEEREDNILTWIICNYFLIRILTNLEYQTEFNLFTHNYFGYETDINRVIKRFLEKYNKINNLLELEIKQRQHANKKYLEYFEALNKFEANKPKNGYIKEYIEQYLKLCDEMQYWADKGLK